ncbi:MAG TPA: DUF4383 domain-containing protein [Ktedonobacterales bacterium]|jgi:Na+/proline symporter|nr:DUF4383 domain-containing protein [Ktedonobacterales bacterium]
MPDVNESAPPEQRERAAYGAPPEEHTIPQPIAIYYAFLVGGALATLGILGFIPPFTKGGALFDIMRVTTATNFLHLATGLAGLGVAFLRKRRYATIYAAIIGAIYVVTFSNGNVDYGNLSGTFGPNQVLPRLQWITFNGLHAALMLASWLVAALSAMQKGDRATRQYRSERRWFVNSRTHTEA